MLRPRRSGAVMVNKELDILILEKELMEHYRDVFYAEMSPEQLRNSSTSPFYHDCHDSPLSPAFFTHGTEDCFLDGTVMMSAKWQMGGGKAVVKIFPGAVHEYTLFPRDKYPEAKEGLEANCAFVRERTE
ncbi:MAG: hypothetical protein Q9179_001542 [Wetmoreana sp. 5 TL-2023]